MFNDLSSHFKETQQNRTCTERSQLGSGFEPRTFLLSHLAASYSNIWSCSSQELNVNYSCFYRIEVYHLCDMTRSHCGPLSVVYFIQSEDTVIISCKTYTGRCLQQLCNAPTMSTAQTQELVIWKTYCNWTDSRTVPCSLGRYGSRAAPYLCRSAVAVTLIVNLSPVPERVRDWQSGAEGRRITESTESRCSSGSS